MKIRGSSLSLRLLLSLLSVVVALLPAPATAYIFNYPAFCPWPHLLAVPGGTRPSNSAVAVSGDKLRLVQAGVDGDGEMNALLFAGAAGSPVMARADERWSSVFTMAADRQKDKSGAGGYAFVIASPGDDFKLGAIGSGLGYAGLDEIIAIEFDMERDSDVADPDGNHVSVHTSGAYPAVASAAEASTPLGVVCVSRGGPPGKPWIADTTVVGDELGIDLGGKIYAVNISWAPTAPGHGTLLVRIESGESEDPDGFATLLTCAVDLAAAMGKGGGSFPTSVVVGFTAANYLGDGASGEDTSNISLHAWLLETSTAGAACFPPGDGREPAFDAASSPPCQPLVPAALTCASLSAAGGGDPGATCIACVSTGRLCDCAFCGAQNVCGDKSAPPVPCGNKVTTFASCPYVSPSASPSATPSISTTSTSTGTSTGTRTATSTSTAAPAAGAAAGAAQLPPAAAAGVGVGVVAVLALAAGLAWVGPRRALSMLSGARGGVGIGGDGSGAKMAPLRAVYNETSRLRMQNLTSS